MIDDIQHLIDINDRNSAFEYLKYSQQRTMREIACRLIYKGIEDNTFISQITFRPIAEIEELRTSLTLEEAMVELGLSEKSLRKYIRRGLTMHNGKIPRHAVEIMRDPAYCIKMQFEFQREKLENQTKEERIEDIREQIVEFEDEFGGEFEIIYGHLSDEEIDEMDNSIDLKVWRDLVEELLKNTDN